MENRDLLAKKRDLFARRQVGDRHDSDPIWVQTIAVPLAVLDYGVDRRRRIASLLDQLNDRISTAKNTSPERLQAWAFGLAK